MKISLTGHLDIERGLGIKQTNNHIYDPYAFNTTYDEILKYLIKFCKNKNITLDDLTLISGMARGADEIFAYIAMDYNLPLIIVVPKSVQYHKNKIVKKTPNIKIQAIQYEMILKYHNLENIIEVNDNLNKGNYGYFLARNQKMVDIADYVISYKKYESGGTNDCIQRAILVNKYYGNVS